VCTAVWVAIPGAIFVFLLDDHHDVEEALHGVEWDTLIFFAALFVMVEGLAEMGLLRLIGGTLAHAIEHLAPETRQVYAIIMVRWHSPRIDASDRRSQLLAPQGATQLRLI
jgi:Na+/H+ antiporter NhaD/arsenite permease-like protein